jgi:transcriptional regulator with XRE-family HTH domain
MFNRPRANPIDAVIGARIRLARRERKVSQSALAACIGHSLTTVQNYEKGKNRITAATLLLVARSLETPATYFYADLDGSAGVTPGPLAPSHG